MRELIYKDEAYKAIDNCICDSWYRISPTDAKMNIRHLVSDANEVDRPKGAWIDTHKVYCGSTVYACSECKSEIDEIPTYYDKPMYKWCPYCGADMRGE